MCAVLASATQSRTKTRSRVGRVVESVAQEAETYLEEKLQAAEAEYQTPLLLRRGVLELLVELDGCEIRTVKCENIRDSETKKITKRVRELDCREVRVGLAGRLQSATRTFVARLGIYAPGRERIISRRRH